MIIFPLKITFCTFSCNIKSELQINVEVRSNNSHDKRINIVDVLKPADDVIENYYYERSRKRKLPGYDDEDEVSALDVHV